MRIWDNVRSQFLLSLGSRSWQQQLVHGLLSNNHLLFSKLSHFQYCYLILKFSLFLELKAQRNGNKKNLQKFLSLRLDLLIRRYKHIYWLICVMCYYFLNKLIIFLVQIFFSRGDLGILRNTKRQVTMPEVCGNILH